MKSVQKNNYSVGLFFSVVCVVCALVAAQTGESSQAQYNKNCQDACKKNKNGKTTVLSCTKGVPICGTQQELWNQQCAAACARTANNKLVLTCDRGIPKCGPQPKQVANKSDKPVVNSAQPQKTVTSTPQQSLPAVDKQKLDGTSIASQQASSQKQVDPTSGNVQQQQTVVAQQKVQTQQAVVVPTESIVEMPLLGTISMHDAGGGKKTGNFPAQGTSFVIGDERFLSLSSGVFDLSESGGTNKLQFSGNIQVLGMLGKCSMTDVVLSQDPNTKHSVVSKGTLAVTFDADKGKFSLYPGLLPPVVFSSAKVAFDGKIVTLELHGKLVAQDIVLTGTLDVAALTAPMPGQQILPQKEKDKRLNTLSLVANFQKAKIGDLIPELKNGMLENIAVTGKISWSWMGGLFVSGKLLFDEADEKQKHLAGFPLESAAIAIRTVEKRVYIEGAIKGLPLIGQISVQWNTAGTAEFLTGIRLNDIAAAQEWHPFGNVDELKSMGMPAATAAELQKISITGLCVDVEAGIVVDDFFKSAASSANANTSANVSTGSDYDQRQKITDELKLAAGGPAGLVSARGDRTTICERVKHYNALAKANSASAKFISAVRMGGMTKIFDIDWSVVAKVEWEPGGNKPLKVSLILELAQQRIVDATAGKQQTTDSISLYDFFDKFKLFINPVKDQAAPPIANQITITGQTKPVSAQSGALLQDLRGNTKISPQQSDANFWQDALKRIIVEKVRLVATNTEETIVGIQAEKVADFKVKPGLNLQAVVTIGKVGHALVDNLYGILKKTEGIDNPAGITLQLSGFLDPTNIRATTLRMGLSSGNFVLPLLKMNYKGQDIDVFSLKNGLLNLVVTFQPAIGFGGEFTLSPGKDFSKLPDALRSRLEEVMVQDQDLKFGLDFMFTPISFKVTGGMLGEWTIFDSGKKAGDKRFAFQIGNCAVNAAQTYSVLAEAAASFGTAALIPAELGLAGCFLLGRNPDKCHCSLSGEADKIRNNKNLMSGEIGLNIGKDVSRVAFLADIKNPPSIETLFDLLATEVIPVFGGPQIFNSTTLPEALKAKYPQLGALADVMKNLCGMQLRNARIKFVPFGAQIWQVNLTPGIGAALYFDVPGIPAGSKSACGAGNVCGTSGSCIDVNLGLDGAWIKGECPPVNINLPGVNGPVFSLTGSNGGSNPCIDGMVSLSDLHMYLDGMAKINIGAASLSSATRLLVGTDTIEFTMKSALALPMNKSINCSLKGTAISPKDVLTLDPNKVSLRFDFDAKSLAGVLPGMLDTFANEINTSFGDYFNAQSKARSDAIQKKLDDAWKAYENAGFWTKGAMWLAYVAVKTDTDIKKVSSTIISSINKDIKSVTGIDVGAIESNIFSVGAGLLHNFIANSFVIDQVYGETTLADFAQKGIIKGLTIKGTSKGQPVCRKLPDVTLLDPLGAVNNNSGAIGLVKSIIFLAYDSFMSTIKNTPIASQC